MNREIYSCISFLLIQIHGYCTGLYACGADGPMLHNSFRIRSLFFLDSLFPRLFHFERAHCVATPVLNSQTAIVLRVELVLFSLLRLKSQQQNKFCVLSFSHIQFFLVQSQRVRSIKRGASGVKDATGKRIFVEWKLLVVTNCCSPIVVTLCRNPRRKVPKTECILSSNNSSFLFDALQIHREQFL